MERKTQKHKQLKGLFSWLSVSFRFFQFFQLNESLCFFASLLRCFFALLYLATPTFKVCINSVSQSYGLERLLLMMHFPFAYKQAFLSWCPLITVAYPRST